MPETKPRPRPGGKTETEAQKPKPRPRPGAKTEAEKPDEKTQAKLPPVGTPDKGSRAKADNAAQRAQTQEVSHEAVPMNQQGKPLARVMFSASELVPTGQYANVSIGPAVITLWIDLDREVGEEDHFFEPHEKAALVKAVNELAEVVEYDVLAVQRNAVLESLQES